MLNRFEDKLSPAVKYWIFLIGIVAVIFAVLFGSFAASYLNLAADEQALFDALFDKLIPYPFIGAIVLVAFISTMVSLIFRYYVIPVLRMAEQARLITTANPSFRIAPEGARELVMLADVINESAEAFQTLREDVDKQVHQSNLAVKEERNRLAALMSELPYGVVVCNRDGKILLYNPLAQKMLQSASSVKEGVGPIGLGRSVFGALERDPLVHALEVMNHAFAEDQAKPALGLMTKMCDNRFIRVNMAPVTTGDEENRALSGFVLSLEDITGEVDADNERDRLLQEMVDAIQNSLGRLHKEVHDVCTRSGNEQVACRNHRQAIDRITVELDEHLALARKLYTEHRRAFGNRENVLAETLMKMVVQRIDERFAMTSAIDAGEPVWLKIDSYAIVQLVTTLAGLLKAKYGIVDMQQKCTGSNEALVALSLSWAERTVPTQDLRDWMSAPLFMDSEGRADSPEAIIHDHGGRLILSGAEKDFCSGVSISLPTALDEESAGSSPTVAPRPVSYEFDLFHQPGQQALSGMPLRKLTFVAFDTETTGLNPSEGDEIIQVGAVRIVNSRLLQNEIIDQLVNPLRPVSKTSVQVHGIDPDLLPAQPTISEVLPLFHDFARDAVLVAHNAAFDMRFLQLKEEATGLRFDNPVLDTLLLSSVVHPNQEGHSLDDIAERFDLTIVGRHTALGDAMATAEILLKLIPLLEAQGISTLGEALEASSRSPFARLKY